MSEQVFEQLVNSHYEGLYRFALSLTQSEADASDLVQETYLAWAEKGRQLRDPRRAKSWLFTTLYRRFLGQRRRASRFPHHELEAVEGELPAVPPVNLAEVDGPAVLAALGQVVEEFREPLVLFYLQDHSYKEIAEILDLPIGTVMSRLYRGKAALRKALAAHRASLVGKTIPFPDSSSRQAHE